MLKGKACVNCRRRKIKCDGEKPVCSQCARSNGSFEDCEYPGGGPTQTQILEERISHVQSRIHQLENPSEIISVPLHHPYDPASIANFDFAPNRSWSAPSHSRRLPTTRSPMTTPSPVSRSPALRSISTATLTHIQEPPPDVMQLVADAFYHHCPRFGFFLNIERFHKSFLLQFPVGHPARPSAALINAVFLWGTHLSPTLAETYDERAFLRNTLHYLSKDLSSSHPQKVLHGIQAEVLLSYYYLKNGKVLEGNYHANAAVSLSLSAGLHRIRTPGTSNIFQGNIRPSNPALPSPTDGIEEGERIDAFWAVLVLNNYWVAIQESHLMFYDLQNVEVDTPWPMDSTEYELHLLPQESSGTIKNFLENTSIEGMSITALHAKAAVLLEQATVLRTHGKKPASCSEALIQLDSLIDQFKSNFPLLDRLNSRAPGRETLLITQMMAHVATIKLHQPFSDGHKHSRDKSLFSAQSIAGLTRDMMPTRALQIDPILGVLWTSACEVIMQEMSRSTANHGQWMPLLQVMLSQMTKFSAGSVLMKFLVTRLQRKFTTTTTVW
ncbi:hypothetical protein BDZ94DRAFT_1189325 [Collybia nuda]|uniref:Zn(2)-C6 fungal-type domain-containing protein n=1 Tax=Collybia nuda TaxID=64659 RepID=A0A9P5Y8E0_9AGAR|nr:hypothetical protein BDZ94DRAFT_1189325 [Collybia nuda]